MPVFESSYKVKVVRGAIKSGQKKRINLSFFRNAWKLIPSVPATFVQQIVIYLPYVIGLMAIVQIIASISFSNPSLYTNSSIELMPYGLTEFWQQLYVLNIFLVIILQLGSVYGLLKRKVYSWWFLVFACGLMITNNILILSVFGVMFSFLWLTLILQIQKEYS